MSTGNVNLCLASALMAERRRDAERSRRWLLWSAGAVSARATPERRRLSLRGSLVGGQPRQA